VFSTVSGSWSVRRFQDGPVWAPILVDGLPLEIDGQPVWIQDPNAARGSWSVQAAANYVTSTVGGSWSVRNFVQATAQGSWSVRNFASSTQAGSWSVRGFVSSQVSGSWIVRNFIASTAGGAWSVRNFVTSNVSGSWSVLGAVFVTSTVGGSWSVRGYVSSVAYGAWSVGDAPIDYMRSVAQPWLYLSKPQAENNRSEVPPFNFISVAPAEQRESIRSIQ
jgi:hypothetical protein